MQAVIWVSNEHFALLITEANLNGPSRIFRIIRLVKIILELSPSRFFAPVTSTHKRNNSETPLPKRTLHRMLTPIECIMRGSC